MKIILTRCMSVMCLLLITACGPVYKTSYQFSAPPTQTGKVCANQCLTSLHSCRNLCEEKRQRCREYESLEAKIEYLEYANLKLLNDEKVDKTKKDFENFHRCDSQTCENQCEESQRICHVNCGGSVQELKTCTAFCQ